MPSIPATIMQQLHHPHTNQRALAIRSLMMHNHQDVLPILIQILQTETDLMLREDITFALAQIGELTVAPLTILLANDDAKIRHDAVHALGKIGHSSAISALIPMLCDENPRVIIKTLVAMGQIGSTDVIPELIPLVGHDNLEIQSTLLTLLEQFGQDAVPYLLILVEDERWQVREQAIDALGLIGEPSVIAILQTALSDEVSQVRFAAQMALKSFV